jgi:upstream activation factor subunit UAF30
LDDKLKTIFPGKTVTMFTMQKHLSKHVFVDDRSESEAEESEEEEEETAPPKKKKKAAAAPKAAAAAKKKPAAKQKPAAASGDAPKKLTGFTKPLNMTADMSAWMGKDTASRPEITKFFWTYIKANNLQDPSNKQYVLCDDTLRELTGKDRFLAFGFSKLVKNKILGYAD